MIPSVISAQIQRGIEDFLRTTFPPSNPFFHGILDRLFADREQLFKGPYISVKLPFRPGKIGRDFFDPFGMAFDPFLHQEKAFQRLTGEEARSTIISTGTGSGKTGRRVSGPLSRSSRPTLPDRGSTTRRSPARPIPTFGLFVWTSSTERLCSNHPN